MKNLQKALKLCVCAVLPFAKGGGKKPYSNTIYYDHSSTLKTVEEIFGVTPLLGAAGDAATRDLSDLFRNE